MKNLLVKEMKLSASILSYLFIAFGVMAIIPGYPILVGGFFICFGIFHTFQSCRENNDILYTVLLPVKKVDTVKAKYCFTVMIQMLGFLLAFVITILRMTVLNNASPYVNNPMMNANQIFLAWILLVYCAFNIFFVNGFFKTAYKLGGPFITFGIVTLVMVGIAETMHHVPSLRWLNDTATIGNVAMWIILAAAFVIYVVSSLFAVKASIANFENVDM